MFTYICKCPTVPTYWRCVENSDHRYAGTIKFIPAMQQSGLSQYRLVFHGTDTHHNDFHFTMKNYDRRYRKTNKYNFSEREIPPA